MGNITFGNYTASRELTDRGQKQVTVGIFFDGTLNNRKNTRARKAALNQETASDSTLTKGSSERQKGITAFKEEKDVSYYNDESNVSRLERFYKKDDKEILKVYIEGIGTDNFEGDALLSKTMGAFSRGIGDKVDKGCKEIVNLLKELKYTDPSEKHIETLQFDVYGFSRGAAAARHFIYQVMRTDNFSLETDIITGFTIDKHPKRGYLGQYLHKNKINVKRVKIRFVGLYETVASYGLIHFNDVFQLKLNKLYHAEKVVHLTAQDEIRENFSLIDIKSANNKGLTITMPGVHSDIGGGYEENIKQEKVLLWDGSRTSSTVDPLNIGNMLFHYLLEGWYKKDTINKRFQLLLLRNELYGERKNLTNTYSIIPLQMMAKLSTEHKATFEFSKLERAFSTKSDTFLSNVQKKLEQQLAIKREKSNYVELLPFDRKENAKNVWTKMIKEYESIGDKYQAKAISKSDFKDYYKNFKRDKNYLLEECSNFIDNSSDLKELIKKDWKNIESNKYFYEEYTTIPETTRLKEELKIQDIEKMQITGILLDEVVVVGHLNDINKIKKLRNKYLHISHTYENSAVVLEPLKPCFNYKRIYRTG